LHDKTIVPDEWLARLVLDPQGVINGRIVWRKSAQNPALTAFLEILRTAIPAIRNQMEL
jgi:hypothetical protein